jgi:hypothetical protein
MKTSGEPTTAGGVYRLLHELWPSNGYAILPEVGNGTGSNARRHADAVVMSLWPSRGLHICGVEIKVSRSDWQSELRKPEKAEAVAKYCDGWYLAVSSSSIVHPGELPPTWGLIVCDGGKAKIKSPAPPMSPIPLDRGFVAAMLRRASEFCAPDEWVTAQREALYAKAKKGAEDACHAQMSRLQTEVDRLNENISTFEQKSGIRISGFYSDSSAENLKQAMRVIAEADVPLDLMADRLQRASEMLRKLSADLKEPADA